MGAMKEMMMELGEKGMIHVTFDEIARWEAATGETVRTEIVAIGQADVLCISADDARRIVRSPFVTLEDAREIAWRIEVGGID